MFGHVFATFAYQPNQHALRVLAQVCIQRALETSPKLWSYTVYVVSTWAHCYRASSTRLMSARFLHPPAYVTGTLDHMPRHCTKFSSIPQAFPGVGHVCPSSNNRSSQKPHVRISATVTCPIRAGGTTELLRASLWLDSII
eukprot:5481053-Amphidinium_carterae.2